MKRSILSLLMLAQLAFYSVAHGQNCYSDPQFISENIGIYPLGPMQMDCGGLTSSKTISTRPDTTVFMIDSLTFHIELTRIDSVGGLPPGLSLQTDVMNTATTEFPYGVWANPGTPFDHEPIVGCISIVGSASAWNAASTGGPNNDGIYPLTIRLIELVDTVSSSDPLSSILGAVVLASGTWSPNAVGLNPRSVQLQLRVNESACNGDLSVMVAVDGDDSSTPACDGEVDVEVFYGTPPYTYTYSTGASGSAHLNNLCTGIYTVSVTDAVGSIGTYEFAVPSDTNIYSNIVPGLPAWVDTLYDSYPSCTLDFFAPIDSFEITSAYAQAGDTLVVFWLVWQNGNPYTLASEYLYMTNDPVILCFVVYCENGRSQPGVFQLFEYFDPSTLGLNDVQVVEMNIYPNPTSSSITLQSHTPLSHAWLTDLAGRRLMPLRPNDTQWHADLSALPTGMYLVEAISEDGKRGVNKVVRE
ncbi:MAG: T9SS type A sorting domain-containing protein [Flavobacteriales bacterium]|nr:T9SS type A sorting domain-containing protein [Flavobacteriales bacterium]